MALADVEALLHILTSYHPALHPESGHLSEDIRWRH